MIVLAFCLLLQTQPSRPDGSALREQSADAARRRLTALVARSGRILSLGQEPRERLSPAARITPGAPPVLRFRSLEAKRRHRMGELDLVMDDAGH
jgi:hypothetical protein